MFQNLLNFSVQKNWKEAIAFYFFYLFIGLSFGGVLSTILAIIMLDHSNADDNFVYEMGFRIGYVSMIYFTIFLSLLLIMRRRLYKPKAIILGIVAVIASLFAGLVSIAVVAYMTTLKNNEVS
jgi:hypothetical protein